MSRLMLSMVLGVAGLVAQIPDGQTAPPLRRFEYSQIHMGVAVKITLYAETEAKAESAAKAAYSRFAELEQVMSDYRPTSEINELCRRAVFGPIKVSDDLFRVLAKSLEIAKKTDGAFDPTVGPLVALWREARRTGHLPTKEKTDEAKDKVGWRFVDLDRKKRTVFISKYGVRIDFGGIAKGDACDQAMLVLKKVGIRSAMVEAGGDLKVSEPPPGEKGWKIGILNTVSERTRQLPLKTLRDAESTNFPRLSAALGGSWPKSIHSSFPSPLPKGRGTVTPSEARRNWGEGLRRSTQLGSPHPVRSSPTSPLASEGSGEIQPMTRPIFGKSIPSALTKWNSPSRTGPSFFVLQNKGGTSRILLLKNAAISTSGDAEQFAEIGGIRYSHIVDPKTGLGLTNRLQCSVIAKDGLLTDPLATAFCVLGEEKSRRLAQKLGVRTLFVRPR